MKLRSWLRSTPDALFPDELPGEALFLGEAPETVALCRLRNAPAIRWTRADVFTLDWNLRVRRLGNAVRTVTAGPVPGREGFGETDRERVLDEAGGRKLLVLWGRQNAGEDVWLELRIPHLMTPETGLHPDGHGVEHEGEMVRRQLVAVPHKDEGGNLFHRYAGLSYAETDADDTLLKPIS